MKVKKGRKKVVWTMGYEPFNIGGFLFQPIGTEVQVGEKVPVGKGHSVYVVHNPRTKQTHIVEARSGAFIGSSLASVKKDVEMANPEVMKKQVADALKTLKRVRVMRPEEFWRKNFRNEV